MFPPLLITIAALKGNPAWRNRVMMETISLPRNAAMPRITLEFTDELYKKLEDLAGRENIPTVEIIRRALALYSYAQEETADNKRKLSITDSNKVIKNIVFD